MCESMFLFLCSQEELTEPAGCSFPINPDPKDFIILLSVILLAVHISRRFFLLKEKASGTDSESSHTSRLDLLVHNPQMFLIS